MKDKLLLLSKSPLSRAFHAEAPSKSQRRTAPAVTFTVRSATSDEARQIDNAIDRLIHRFVRAELDRQRRCLPP